MENWIIYGLIGSIFFGVGNFYSKVIAAKGLNRNRVFIYSMFTYIIVGSLFLAFNFHYAHLSFLIIAIAIVRVIVGIEKYLFTMKSLEYIETSLFFPIHQIVHVFLAFVVGMLFFSEYLTPLELSSIFIGIIIILLLSDKENRKIQIDYKKGFIFLIISNLFLLLSSTINKYIVYIDFDIPTYMVISGLSGVLYLYFTKGDISESTLPSIKKEEMQIGFSRGLFTGIGFLCILYALKDGPFVLVQMLLSLSIFTPILLSIIIFDEKINKKKILAFILLIVVIYLISI